MPSQGYRRVPSGEDLTSAGQRNNSQTRSERLFDKLYAMAWVTVAVVVARFTNFFPVIFSDERVNRPVLLTAFVCLVVNTVLVLYLTVYLPKVKKLTDSSAWDVYCPNVIPSMTFVGIVCAILLVRATWPVWGFLAPLILGLEAMGALFALHFIPWY